MASTITAFKHPTDVNVIITEVHPQPMKGLGNLAILHKIAAAVTPPKPADQATQPSNTTGGSDKSTDKGTKKETPNKNGVTEADVLAGILMRKIDTATGSEYEEFKNEDAVKSEFDETTSTYKMAQTYFAQAAHSDRIAVISYVTGKLEDTLKDFWNQNFTFMIFDDNNVGDDATLASNICEANKDHFLVLQSNNTSDFSGFEGQNYTIGCKHDTSEAMAAALVGAIANKPVGSVTWKFKQMVGITPEDLTVNELEGINSLRLIAYENVLGTPETTEGKVLSGEYIDSLHGEIWVKTHMESALENLLQTNDKIPYETRGINMVLATGTEVLEEAWEQGIILTDENTGKGDYTITATPRSQQSQQDLSDRHYGGLSFTYHMSGAIHTITVYGTVNSDTILQNA